MKLNPQQVSQISQKISSNQVYYADIRAELTDHIACKIEAELHTEDDFEEILQKSLSEVNPKKFQQSLLIQAHLNSLKEFVGNLGNPRIMVKTILMTFLIGSFINLFSKNTPEFAESVLKTAFLIACYGCFILVLWGNKYFGNSKLLTAANVLFLLTSLSQFFLRLEWLTWTGGNNQQILFSLSACFSFIICSGYTNIYRQFKKLKPA
jgi:ABC-type multidrug transport system fused ATPase/permease subunit